MTQPSLLDLVERVQCHYTDLQRSQFGRFYTSLHGFHFDCSDDLSDVVTMTFFSVTSVEKTVMDDKHAISIVMDDLCHYFHGFEDIDSVFDIFHDAWKNNGLLSPSPPINSKALRCSHRLSKNLKTLRNITISCGLNDLYRRFWCKVDYADDIANLFGYLDFNKTEWVRPDDDCCITRTFYYNKLLDIKLPMVPKSAAVEQIQRLYWKKANVLVYESKVITIGAPTSKNFHVEERWTYTDIEGRETQINYGVSVIWKPDISWTVSLLKGTINSKTEDTCTYEFDKIIESLGF